MYQFPTPTFGATNGQQGYGSPKPAQTYQPMPAVGTPSFGAFGGRPSTPKETSRHSSYSSKDETTIPLLPPSVERQRRHRDYYFEGGDIYFLAENYLFRVHKYFFERESPVFRKQFADIAVSGHHRLGASDSDPLILHEVRADDFSRFLWVFYNPIYSIYDANTEDWAAILGLAHHWQFAEVKLLVIRELEKQVIPSIYKIVIYHRHNVDRGLLLPAYTDLVSREETLSIEEAKDLGLETSLMIMTAREIVRKGDAPTSAMKISPEDLRSIIRQVFRFPGLRSDSPFSDVTAAEPALDHRSPPLVAEKTDLPTVPEHENETVPFTASASLNSSHQPATETPASAPIISAPTPPVLPPSAPKKQGSFKSTTTPNKQEPKSVTVSPPKEDPKPKDEPAKPIFPQKRDNEPKQNIQEPAKSATEEKINSEAQEPRKRTLSSRLANAGKGASNPIPANDATTLKDKDGDKPTDNQEAKNAKNTTGAKDASGSLPTGQDPNETPNGTPLLSQGPDQPGTPTTGQSVSAKKTKALLARAGKIRRKEEMETSSSNKGKDKEMRLEGPRAPPPREEGSSRCGVEHVEQGPKAKEMGTDMGENGKGKKVADDEENDEGKPADAVDVRSSKGNVRTDSSGNEKKVDVGQDTKKSGHSAVNSSDDVTPVIATDHATKPVAEDLMPIPLAAATKKTNHPEVSSLIVNAAPTFGTPTATTDKKEDATKEKVDPIIAEENAEQASDGKTIKPKGPVITEEGDVATPKRVTKELPASPEKSAKEKVVPTLGLTVPMSPRNGSASSCTLSPLQKALDDAEDETLMERMARLELGSSGSQPPKEVAPPANTDIESEFECETAPSGPSTPISRADASFNLLLRSEVALSDDDDLFIDCDSNASVSHFDGL